MKNSPAEGTPTVMIERSNDASFAKGMPATRSDGLPNEILTEGTFEVGDFKLDGLFHVAARVVVCRRKRGILLQVSTHHQAGPICGKSSFEATHETRCGCMGFKRVFRSLQGSPIRVLYISIEFHFWVLLSVGRSVGWLVPRIERFEVRMYD